ncbi:MAG: carboxylesterase family protein [Actinobacteria bacterium]|nr:carboxylesterase family protein [Actinomycetota bacterium]
MSRWGRIALVIVCVLCLVVTVGCGSREATMDQPVLDSGAIRGVHTDGVWSYLGIPYAASPLGELRWRPAEPVESWKGVRVCDAYGPSCPQEVGAVSMGPLGVGETSEDCLYLNAWSPATDPADRLPVMVWLHGGSFVSGSASMGLYNGENLARLGGVVVIGVNYRLGPLGFLAHPALSAESPDRVSGNYGLMDQVSALEWVQRNVACLGGDPERVTVFGESAGAMSILHLMVMPRAEGLFHRAILQSAVLLEEGFGGLTGVDLATAETAGAELILRLGVGRDDPAAMRSVSPEELLAATSALPTDFLSDGLSLAPVVDGVVVPLSVSRAFAAGMQHEVALILGSNADEGNTFLSWMEGMEEENYCAWARGLFGPWADEVLAMYPCGDAERNISSISRMLTELGFAATARYVTESQVRTKESPVYLYEFTRVPLQIALPGAPQGAFHGLELPYVFGQAALFGVVDPVDLALSERIMEMWTRFAATGDPNPPGDELWPRYTAATAHYLELGDKIVVGSRLYEEAYELSCRIREAGLQ